jgi:hypothetical protein
VVRFVRSEQWNHKIIKRKNGKKKYSLIIWLIFFLFIQTKPSFCRLIAWSQLDFSTIPVSFSAVSLRRLSTYMLILIRILILIILILILLLILILKLILILIYTVDEPGKM